MQLVKNLKKYDHPDILIRQEADQENHKKTGLNEKGWHFAGLIYILTLLLRNTNIGQMAISEIPRSFLLTSLPPCNQIDGIITVMRDKLMTVLSAPEMRFGTKQDVPFIIAVIRDGMRDGYFNFDDDDGLSQFESQISEAIARRERGENCADFLFVFDAPNNGAAIGFALLTGKNGANGLASHLEIRMFGVTRSERQKGFGRSMLLAGDP